MGRQVNFLIGIIEYGLIGFTFYNDIIYNRKLKANLNDSYQKLKIINKIYNNSKYDYFT